MEEKPFYTFNFMILIHFIYVSIVLMIFFISNQMSTESRCNHYAAIIRSLPAKEL